MKSSIELPLHLHRALSYDKSQGISASFVIETSLSMYLKGNKDCITRGRFNFITAPVTFLSNPLTFKITKKTGSDLKRYKRQGKGNYRQTIIKSLNTYYGWKPLSKSPKK